MGVKIYLLLVCFSFLLSAGQVLFKMVAKTASSLTSISGLLGLASNLWFWAALILYGTATLLWIFILQKASLSQAYPFVALGFIIVPVASYFLFSEPLNLTYAGGVVLILAGLWVITRSAAQL